MYYACKEVAPMVTFLDVHLLQMPWYVAEYGKFMFTTVIITQKERLKATFTEEDIQNIQTQYKLFERNTTLMKVVSVLCKPLNNTKVLMKHGPGCMTISFVSCFLW
jgi:hypothetical protein